MNYHIGRLVLSSLCVGDLVRLVLCGARFAGFSLVIGNYYSFQMSVFLVGLNKRQSSEENNKYQLLYTYGCTS